MSSSVLSADRSPDPRPAVVLLSGGLDSATALAVARREEGDRLNAIVSAQVKRIAELADAAIGIAGPLKDALALERW